MVKNHIDNNLIKLINVSPRFLKLDTSEKNRVYKEALNATLQEIDEKLYDLAKEGAHLDNEVNSLLLWTIGLDGRNEKPTGPQKIKSAGSYADFDVDFSKQERGRVYEYLAEKYGSDRVTHVATFGTLGAKAAVRSSARALGNTVDQGSQIAKHIPNVPDIKLKDAIEASDALKEILNGKDLEAKKILETALKLEGLPNSIGCHASACVITAAPLTDYMPLMIATKKDGGDILTQFEYKDVESLGCLKWDILGLKTLDVIKGTVELVKKNHGVDICIEDIDVEDPSIYELINNGHNTGIFQFESDIFASAVRQVKPQNINEISDLTSLLRPGPLSMGMLGQYIAAKFQGEKYTYKLSDKKLIEKVWEICSASYGLMVYQEQVIKCFTQIAGFNEIEGDNARRAMGKKKPEEMAKLQEQFVSGGSKLGYKEKDLAELFKQIEGFSGYGFNRSHAVCYSVITCHTAWLSANYPMEFFATLLTIDFGNTDDVRRYVSAFKQRGYKIEAPNINRSDASFKIDGDSIIFGLTGIKGVGPTLSNKILKKRPKKGYQSLGDFIVKNIDILNKKVVEQYAKAGAFSPFGVNKASALKSVDDILDFMDVQKNVSEFYTIFDMAKIDLAGYFNACKVAQIDKPDALEYEIETLGLYITKHPMEVYLVNPDKGAEIKDISENAPADSKVLTVGAICGIDVRKTKSKTNMATFNLTTATDSIKCIVFPKKYSEFLDVIQEGKVVAVMGRIQEDEDERQISIDSIKVDISPFVCKIEVKVEDEYQADRWVSSLMDDDPVSKLLGVIINQDLSYILERA